MAHSPSRTGFFRAVRLCALLLLDRKKFLNESLDEDRRLNLSESTDFGPDGYRGIQIDRVRRAFLVSFVLVAGSICVGVALAWLVAEIDGCPSSFAYSAVQIVGAAVLLWGTLFVRGWDVQTMGGMTLPERVNQWIYRALYCMGTVLIVCGTAWPIFGSR